MNWWTKISEYIYINTRVFAENTPGSTGNNVVTLIQPEVVGLGPGDAAPNLNFYIEKLYPAVIQIAALIAVATFAWWGLRYMFSQIPGVKALGKERLLDVVLGILILLGAWLILKTINPQIIETTFDNLGKYGL